jgi:hypothetical protein
VCSSQVFAVSLLVLPHLCVGSTQSSIGPGGEAWKQRLDRRVVRVGLQAGQVPDWPS